ncbi:unnamed protein product [Phytophthora fragariaefolia]|uniref:Unnamed protein product n=1 Tax=Phytophthora fragariaefolia TaxID=1490495 RepID=A0A9W7D2G1_9STRA|nr:unnamed protein product [Phytophthora fragariaefolia]
MKRTHDEIESRLRAVGDVEKLTPEWFIPWYELIVDKGGHLGTGGFGSVCRGRWLDSEVLVKEVLLPGSVQVSIWGDSYDSLLLSPTDEPLTNSEIAYKRAKAQALFRCEADIWFRFSHPHVVRLFGACHIGRPFFVCEYATHGTLDNYLRKHPGELWKKLREAALGVQYLHACGVVHGDLKGNNIVIGSDRRAKVTDFGLSFSSDSEDNSLISGAWHWVAPECLADKDSEQAEARPTIESDVYCLGMCIVEAMRIVEAARSGKPSRGCLPWGVLDNPVVKYHACRGKLPPRPECQDDQWELVRRMCSMNPKKRVKISTVVDELERLAKTTTLTTTPAEQVTDSTYPESVAFARHLLVQWLETKNQNPSLAVLYVSLWDQFEHVHQQILVSVQMQISEQETLLNQERLHVSE